MSLFELQEWLGHATPAATQHYATIMPTKLAKSYAEVFAERKIGADQLPPASPSLLPFDKDAESKRAATVEQQFGNVASGIVQYTTDVLFRDLWLRPDLAPRDRSLVRWPYKDALPATRTRPLIPFFDKNTREPCTS